ncbi:mCG140609, partial [Mus musculus]
TSAETGLLFFLVFPVPSMLRMVKCSVCIYTFMPEEDIGSFMDGCEPPCGYQKLNSGPLEEQLCS